MKKTDNSYENAMPFLEVYPHYDLLNLPSWVKNDINNARVSGKTKKSIIMPNGKRYNIDNKINHLSGQEWTYFINSVFSTNYPTCGKESYAHKIRKIHPTPKPPQLMKDIITFFTKENELVFDSFMGVGGTLLGAALSGRRAIGIDLNINYINAYKSACKELQLREFPTINGDCLEVLKDTITMSSILGESKISLLLIDPPYSNMMAKEKTGPDKEIYGKNATPFTESAKDLGNMNRISFLESLKYSIELSLPYMKKWGYVVVFIKDLQPKGKELNMLHYDIASKLTEIECLNFKGMKIWADNTTKLYPYGYPFSFVSNQIHQYILVFRKEN